HVLVLGFEQPSAHRVVPDRGHMWHRSGICSVRGDRLPRSVPRFYRSRTMARPVDRDLDEVRARLAEWSSGRIARNAAVEIADLTMPASTGYSGETFLFRARWVDGEQPLVARLKPTGHSVFNSFDFANEYRAIDALAADTARPMGGEFRYEAGAHYAGVP